MEENKKNEDLTIPEAKLLIDDAKNKIKVLQIRVKNFKNEKKLRSTEKRILKDQKTKKLKIIQNEINSEPTKIAKDLKRKNKTHESNRFDSRISSKDIQIDHVENKIFSTNKDINQLELLILNIQKHINSSENS
jgi:hypothetical protein